MASQAMVVDVSQDWASACDVQERFMWHPAATLDALQYSARCRQVRALGGDCYDFLPLPQNRLALAIGDASGKGLAAALMISNVQSSLRTAASFASNDAAAVLGAVNRQVYASLPAESYATLFYGVFDGSTRTLRYVNGGHNPPILIRPDASVAVLEVGGLPVGVFPDSKYEQASIQLHPGDLIVAYTDGVTEAVNAAGEQWGAAGVRKTAVENRTKAPAEIVDAIFQSLDSFSRDRQTDDATVAVLRVSLVRA